MRKNITITLVEPPIISDTMQKWRDHLGFCLGLPKTDLMRDGAIWEARHGIKLKKEWDEIEARK